MRQRFEKAYTSLLNAFMNGTLAAGPCTACAVGNIIADAIGCKVEKLDGVADFRCRDDNAWWSDVFITAGGEQKIYEINDTIENYRKKMFDLTGYRWYELAQVEYAFEKNTRIKNTAYDEYTEQEVMEDQFDGLMAVMDVLIKLDEVAEGQKYKDTFKKKREKFLV